VRREQDILRCGGRCGEVFCGDDGVRCCPRTDDKEQRRAHRFSSFFVEKVGRIDVGQGCQSRRHELGPKRTEPCASIFA